MMNHTAFAAGLDELCSKVDARLAEVSRVPSPPPKVYALVPHVCGCRWPVVLRELHRRMQACIANDIATLRTGVGGLTSTEHYAALRQAIEDGDQAMDAMEDAS